MADICGRGAGVACPFWKDPRTERVGMRSSSTHRRTHAPSTRSAEMRKKWSRTKLQEYEDRMIRNVTKAKSKATKKREKRKWPPVRKKKR